MCSKKSFMLFSVLVLALVFVMPLNAKWGTPTQIQETQISSEETQKEQSTDSQQTLTSLDGKVVIFGSELETVKKDVEDVQSAMALLVQKNEILENNLKKANGTKFFADAGVAIGFGEESVQYGLTADIGMRFGGSFMVKTGVQYMVGSFGAIDIGWDLKKMTVNATVGWEW